MPILDEENIPYLEAFHVLSRVRPIGFGAAAIPYTDIRAWLEITNVPRYEWGVWFGRIIFIDAIFVKHHSDNAESVKHTNTSDQRPGG